MRDMEKQFENNGDWMELHYFLEQLKDFFKIHIIYLSGRMTEINVMIFIIYFQN